jgi:hypothetical protein
MLLFANLAFAQGGFPFQRVVGGVQIDANGALTGAWDRLSAAEINALNQSLKGTNPQLDQKGLRAVSLSAIENALNNAAETKQPIPTEIQFMGGLQRIEYVVVKDGDLLLVGPGEGLETNEQGHVVGNVSGMPTLKLEDFLTAMRTVENARQDYGISVDIRPTDEGIVRHAGLSKQLRADTFNSAVAAQLEQAMGDQIVSVTGVPLDSRYAQVLVSADYRMKRLAMGFEAAPINKFPSYLEMVQQRGGTNAGSAPRFWLECNYNAVAKSDDGKVWKISGTGVKALTEESFYDETGAKAEKKAPKKNAVAEKWAQNMTDRFEDLANADPIFRELRNVMDMSVIAALIAKEGLLGHSNVAAPLLTESNSAFTTPVWQAPKTVPSKCSFIRSTAGWTITTSGGVSVDSWAVVSNQQVDSSLSKIADQVGEAHTSSDVWFNIN